MNAVQNSLLRFGLVGLVGLLVDAGVTLYSFEFLGISPATAKVAGFVLAVSVTYFLHHYYTFALREPALNGVRILQYVAAQAICVLVNVGVFLGVIGLFGETDPEVVLAGTALASLSSSLTNYLLGRWVVFIERSTEP